MADEKVNNALASEKSCTRCGKMKPLSGFYERRSAVDGLCSICKECIKSAAKRWYAANVDKAKEMQSEYRATHPEKFRAAATRHYAKHPDRVNKWRVAHPDMTKEQRRKHNSKTRSTVKGKLNSIMSQTIWRSLRGSKAKHHWEDLVGYTVDQLRMHIEKLFKPGMTWENYGTVWHIDHKMPKAVFNYEHPGDIDFRICWSLKNLQPLEAKKNLSKGAKIDKPFQPSLKLEVM